MGRCKSFIPSGMAEIGTDLNRAAALLAAGALVAIPTETVYGLAGNALDPAAVVRIFEAKNRPAFNPLIVHTGSLAQAEAVVTAFPDPLRRLAEAHWPGPLTLLLPRRSLIPDLVTAGKPRVALRVPAHPLTLELLRQLPFPLAAPSANPFGYISPTEAAHVQAQLGERIPYILDGGPAQIGLESTIVGMSETGNRVEIYRLGGTPAEAIEAVVGPVHVRTGHTDDPAASGMLKSHYAPGTRLLLAPPAHWEVPASGLRVGVLAFSQAPVDFPAEQVVLLSPRGDLGEAAQRLFGALRTLDAAGLDLILAEPVPDHGLGRAINDRLRRASF